MEQTPILDKHIPSLDQNYPEDEHDNIPNINVEDALHQLNNANETINNSNPPPLVDLIALISPKQMKTSKKWSVGANYTSTAIIFEYLESSRLSIQNDGRLFISSSKQTLSATHSSLSSSDTHIPQISHISVPRSIQFNNNAVVRINREWHIGQLSNIMYTSTIDPPQITDTTLNSPNHTDPEIKEAMLLMEQPLQSDDEEESEHELITDVISPSKSYLSWSGDEELICVDENSLKPSDKIKKIAIDKIVHDHNHNHSFFWSYYYDHDTLCYNKDDIQIKDDDPYHNFLNYLIENEDENTIYDVKTQINLIKRDILTATNDNSNTVYTAHYKYTDDITDSHSPLAITHGNNIVLLLFKDGNIWSSYNNHLLQPIPFRPNTKISDDEKKETDEMKEDYVQKTLNKTFKTRPLVIGNWRLGEGKQRWFLIKYVTSNDEIKDMDSAMKEYSTLDWELSKEDIRSKLVYMISPGGRIWSCCSGGCWFNVGQTDKTFNDKYNGLNDKQHKLVCSSLPFCRAGLALVPFASCIASNIAIKERDLIIQQLRCLSIPNEIVPLKVSQNEGDKLRGSYSNIVYGIDCKQKYFVHYNCMYLWDSWRIDNDIYFDRTTTINGYTPYALFMVTRYPFHNSFQRILDNFLFMHHKDAILNDLFIDNLYHLLSSASFNHIGPNVEDEVITISCPNEDTVSFENSTHLMPMTINNRFYRPSLHPDINWSVLFRVLEPMNILTVISGILQEKKIILLSNHPSLLFPCFEVLLSLIYPFQWIHFYRAFIPPSDPNINQYLQLKKPAMFGLMSSSITKIPPSFKGVVVRLESNAIELHRIRLSILPSKLTLWLFASIIQNADFYLHYQPEQQSFIKVPSQMHNTHISAIRSTQFRSTYMNTNNSSRTTTTTTATTTAHARCKSTGAALVPLNTVNNYNNGPKISIEARSLPSHMLSRSLPLSKSNPTPSPNSEYDDYTFDEYKEMYPYQCDKELKEDKDEAIDFETNNASDPRIYTTTTSIPSSEVVVKGEEIISIVDRVLLSNFSSNHSSSLIHQHLADYTQNILQPNPLPKVKDARPDPAWFEPTVFRKYKYYYPHMIGGKESAFMSNHVSKRLFNKKISSEFTVTHQVIEAQGTEPSNTPTPIPTPNESYIFIGLNIKSLKIQQNDNASGHNINRSGVLNWLFSSNKAEQINNNHKFVVNINLLRNHFMRAFASLLSGFWKYIVPIKYSTTTNVEFDGHGFLGSRQEFNYKKQPLEDMLLVCHETKKDEIQHVILQLQSQFDIFFVHELFIAPNPQFNQLFMETFYNINNENVALTPRTIAKFYLSQVYLNGNDIDTKINRFLDEYLSSIITADIDVDNDDDDDDDNDNKYERSMPRSRDTLSSLVLSQFLDGLLSSLLWTHLINGWYFNDNYNDNINDSVYFSYFDVALKAYVVDGMKLKPLRYSILNRNLNDLNKNSIMFKDTSYHHNKKKKSIVVYNINDNKLHCGFCNPWSIRFTRHNNVDDLLNTFRNNINMIMIDISWNNSIGAVVGKGKISFKSWFASFMRKLSFLNSFNDCSDYHEYNDNNNNNNNNYNEIGIQIFVSDVRSLKSAVTTLKNNDLLFVHPLRIWITANLLNGTVSPRSFFKYMDLIPSFTICLICHLFSSEHIGHMKNMVEQYIFKKTKKTKRSFGFCIPSHSLLVDGDGWKYLHSLLLDRFPSSSLIFTAATSHESLSIAEFKWLSAHFPTNRSFYTFETADIDNDFDDLDLLHHVVEATKSPPWYGDFKENRNKNNDDGGVLCSEWRTARFLERSKVYFFGHRFGIVNRGWVLSKHELYPPWKMSGRALITGYTQLHILFRSPGAVYKTTSHGNVVYGIRATITTKGEFALETVRLNTKSNKIKSKINTINKNYKNNKNNNNCGFIFPSTSAAMHIKAFSFQLIDYGALYPIQFSIQQLSITNGYPISESQSIKMQVSYPKDDNKCPCHHYVVFNSHQSAMWPILIDRLVINKDITFKNKFHYLLNQKKTFNKKHFARGISHKKNIADML